MQVLAHSCGLIPITAPEAFMEQKLPPFRKASTRWSSTPGPVDTRLGAFVTAHVAHCIETYVASGPVM